MSNQGQAEGNGGYCMSVAIQGGWDFRFRGLPFPPGMSRGRSPSRCQQAGGGEVVGTQEGSRALSQHPGVHMGPSHFGPLGSAKP